MFLHIILYEETLTLTYKCFNANITNAHLKKGENRKMKEKLEKYRKETDSSNCYFFRKKPFSNWLLEHEQRLQIAVLMMDYMKIGKKIYEFHDADFIQNKRIKTFSDYLVKSHDTTIISKNVENGNFNGVTTVCSSQGYFGNLFEYVTTKNISNKTKNKDVADNSISYNYVDSIIFDNLWPRLENYIRTAVALGKDCYLPITGYKNSKYIEDEVKKQEKIKESILNIPEIDIIEVENFTSKNDGFVKVMRISK